MSCTVNAQTALDPKKAKRRRMLKIAIPIVVVFLVGQWSFIGWKFAFGPLGFLGDMRYAGMPGNADEYGFDAIEPLDESPLAGKNVLFLGSSVTNGRAALYDSVPEYVAARFGCSYVKEAVDGTTLVDDSSSSYVSRLKANVGADEKFDLVVVQLSTNDASKGKELGTVGEGEALDDFDTQTVAGAIEYIVAYVRETYGCATAFYTNARFESDSYQQMVDLIYQVQEKWGIGVIDLWTSDEFNSITDDERALYMKDQIHPYRAGYRDWWGPEIERQLLEYLG